jgi:hypothetical protein
LPDTTAGRDSSYAARSTSRRSTGAENGTGKHSIVVVVPPASVTSSVQSVGSQRVTVIGSRRTSSRPMSRNRSAIHSSVSMKATAD